MDPSIDESRYRELNPRATIERTILVHHTVLQVVHGDLTEEKTDIVTNAANDNLWLGGGVAGAIERKGGPSIETECTEFVRKHGTVKIGGVAVTGAGDMDAKYVIHAVGPIYNFHGNSRSLLRDTIIHTFEAAEDLSRKATDLSKRVQSISIPGISSGIFGFPKDLCADIMFSSFHDYLSAHPDTHLRLIRYINFDTPTVASFESAFDSVRQKLVDLHSRLSSAEEQSHSETESSQGTEVLESSSQGQRDASELESGCESTSGKSLKRSRDHDDLQREIAASKDDEESKKSGDKDDSG